jgi:RNA polymerase sigma-70 factor (ECF subfamily)
VEAYLTPSKQEFESYFTRYRGAVMGFALRRVPAEEAQDVVAETFLVAWRRLDQIPAEPLPWLLGVARNVIATRQRGDRRVTNLFNRLHEHTPRFQPNNPPADRADLAGAFNSLTENDREVLMLIGWDGLSVTQAAEVLGCSPQSLSLRLHRARKRLEARLETDAPFLARRPLPKTEEAR